MKLYYMPGACSIGMHVLLEEIGKPYDLHKVDGANREQYGEAFVKLKPKSKVPTLQKDDGSVLTEFPAIATWLARKNPDKGLMPTDADAEARAFAAGYREISLYTNAAMVENVALYTRLGFREVRRGEANGFQRVWMAKPLGGAAEVGPPSA